MKTIIAGSRTITDYPTLLAAIKECPWVITSVISGSAVGVDQLGEKWAKEKNLPLELFPVTKEDWEAYGKAAGPMRNLAMAKSAEALLLLWDGKSKGSLNMYKTAVDNNLYIHEKVI